LIKINCLVMPDLIRYPETLIIYFLDSPVNPSIILRAVSMSNGPGNDKSLCDNQKLFYLKGIIIRILRREAYHDKIMS